MNQKGQVLVIIMMVMLVSLGIGVGISTTFMKGLRNVANTDSSSKALAVAEALVERLLMNSIPALQGYIQNGNCSANCYLEITEPNGNTAIADAVLSQIGNSSDTYAVKVSQNETLEVNLATYPSSTDLSVCWNGNTASVHGLHVYGLAGSYLADAYAYNPVGSINSINGFSDASASLGYQNCFTVAGKQNPVLLRLRVFYGEAYLYVIPAASTSLPLQGVRLTVTGNYQGVLKKVIVTKSQAAMPSQFDYVLYQKSATSDLAN